MTFWGDEKMECYKGFDTKSFFRPFVYYKKDDDRK